MISDEKSIPSRKIDNIRVVTQPTARTAHVRRNAASIAVQELCESVVVAQEQKQCSAPETQN